MIFENSQFQISELSPRILPCDTLPTAHARAAHAHRTDDRPLCHSTTTTAIGSMLNDGMDHQPPLCQLSTSYSLGGLPNHWITGNNIERLISTHHSPRLKLTSNTGASHQSRRQPAINLRIARQIQNRQHQCANLSMALPCLGCNQTLQKHCASGPWWHFWWTVDEVDGGCQLWIT